jgi:nucleotide-binding universal stress UspA family protein
MPILVATGGAAHSTVALTFGAHLAGVTQSSLVVLTVVKREEERARAENTLEGAKLVLDPMGTEYTTTVRVGHPAEEILAEAESRRYSMVVVGEKQHHGLITRFVLGSTALRVVEHAPCPVVVVKEQVGRVQKMLICDSGYPGASLVDKVTAQLPRLLDGAESITVLHVMSQMSAGPGVDGHQLRADAGELIEEHSVEGEILGRDVSVLGRSGHAAVPKVRHGRVVDEILAEAREGDYDLVIIGAHQGTGWRRILLDDLAHEIVVRLDRPVLVVR